MLLQTNKNETLEDGYSPVMLYVHKRFPEAKVGTVQVWFTKRLVVKTKHLISVKTWCTATVWHRKFLSPQQETACRWCCVQSPRSRCYGPSEILPSRPWICQGGQRRWQNSRPSEGWQLYKMEGERHKVSFKTKLERFMCLQIILVHDCLMWIISSRTC